MEIIFLQNLYSIIVILVPLNIDPLGKRTVFEIFLSSSLKQGTSSTLLPPEKPPLWGQKHGSDNVCFHHQFEAIFVLFSRFSLLEMLSHLPSKYIQILTTYQYPNCHQNISRRFYLLPELLSDPPTWVLFLCCPVVHCEHRRQSKPIKPKGMLC